MEDTIDRNKSECYALIYLMPEMIDGVIKVFPGVHGLYETWHAAEEARRTKANPNSYYNVRSIWRKI